MKIEIDNINAVLSLLFSSSLINTKEIIGSESQSIVGKEHTKWLQQVKLPLFMVPKIWTFV